MIRHVVSWKIAADSDQERAERAAEVVRRLEALVGVVPTIGSLSAGVNTLYPEKNWDVCLVSDFDSAEALHAYQVHPAHAEAAAYIVSVAASRASVDFELSLTAPARAPE